MDREDILKFTNTMVVLSKLLTKIEDKFFAQKLHDKMTDMTFAFVNYKPKINIAPIDHINVAQTGFSNAGGIAKSDYIVQHSTNVAQYNHANLLNSINNILDYLENLAHVLKKDATPLLAAQRNLLKFKLFILRQSKNQERSRMQDDRQVLGETGFKPAVHKPLLSPRPVIQTAKNKTVRSELKSDSNKEKIFEFVKRSHDVRAKEIMSKFNILSGRTVKRNLKELIEGGFLKKRFDGGAVHYFAVESN